MIRATTVESGGVAAVFAVAVAVLAAGLAAGALGFGVVDAVDAADVGPVGPAAAAEPPGAGPVEPNVSVPASVNRSDPVPVVVSLPESASGSRSFGVRLDAAGVGTLAERTVTVDPGEAARVEFGPCLSARTYAVRVATTDGDVLTAAQTEVDAPADLVTVAGPDWRTEQTVRRDDTLELSASYHECVDRATFTLGEDADRVWSTTVVDADDDGEVALEWDVDAPADGRFAVSDGDALANTNATDGAVPYGTYDLWLSADVEPELTIADVTVGFAAPAVSTVVLDEAANGTAAIETARARSAAGRSGESDRVSVVGEQWVVVRMDTDGTVDSLPADAALVAPATHENATVRVRRLYGPSTGSETEVDLRNATRRFDAANDTVYYAFRANQSFDEVRLSFVALDDDATAAVEPNVTDSVEFTFQPTVAFGFHDGALLAPEAGVEVEGYSPLPDGTRLAVSVREDDRVLAADEAVVEADRVRARLDLSEVANGTNATFVVERDGETVLERPVSVVSRPVLRLDSVHLTQEPVAGEPVNVDVFVSNEGTATGSDVVRVTLGNRTKTLNLTVRPDDRAGRQLRFDSVPETDTLNLSASVAGRTEVRVVEVTDSPGGGATTRPPPTRTPTTPTATPEPTATADETSWPTLVGSQRRTDPSPLPGFGAAVAVLAVLAAAVVVARRGRDGR